MSEPARDTAGMRTVFWTWVGIIAGGLAFAGFRRENEELTEHGQASVDFLSFVTSSSFLVDVSENWQSEFLQFFVFIAATVWFIQRGSPESKKPGNEGPVRPSRNRSEFRTTSRRRSRSEPQPSLTSYPSPSGARASSVSRRTPSE